MLSFIYSSSQLAKIYYAEAPRSSEEKVADPNIPLGMSVSSVCLTYSLIITILEFSCPCVCVREYADRYNMYLDRLRGSNGQRNLFINSTSYVARKRSVSTRGLCVGRSSLDDKNLCILEKFI